MYTARCLIGEAVLVANLPAEELSYFLDCDFLKGSV